MATKENKNNVKANANNESANKVNESATATAKVENESNANANATDESATAESNNESNATDESKSKQEATTSEPTAEEIAAAKVEQKHQTEIANRYTLEAPTEVEKTKFAGAYVLGVWRAPKDVKKNGDKTFFQIYYRGTIYDGFTSTEFCDSVGIERKHRAGNTPKVATLLDKLEALKNAIEAIGSDETDFVNFAKIVTAKIESEQIESQRAAFVTEYAALIPALPHLLTAIAASTYGEDFVKIALKLGYKFADTPTDNESNKESK